MSNRQIIDVQHQEMDRLAKQMARIDPHRNPAEYGAYAFAMSARPGSVSDVLVKHMEEQIRPHNVMAKNLRENSRIDPKKLLKPSELRKSNPEMFAKANLDVGTMANLSQVTGGQSLGYVSLDTRMARGTVRPNAFTLYNSLNKTAAYQVIDFWSYASSTGGYAPGGAFMATSSVGNGALNTSAGQYELKQITLKLALNGRSITTALAAQNSFVNVVEQENTNAALTVMESINWANYWGNSTLYPNMFEGIAQTVKTYAPKNVFDFQAYATANSSAGLSDAQLLFNMIYEVAAEVTQYRTYGQLTHAFMSPNTAGGLQTLVTTLLNNVVNNITDTQVRDSGIVVNGDLQGMKTRFGNIQFPIDLFINARDTPTAAIVESETGASLATTTNPSPPASVTVASGAASSGSAFTAAYVANSATYMYAVASTDESMNESVLTYSPVASGITAGEVYVLTITPPTANDEYGFRVFRSGLGYSATSPQAGAFRYIGDVIANGTSAVTFTDYNTHIPGSETVFLLDMAEEDAAIDFRYLLPLTKIELFAQSLYMPWAVAMIGAIRTRIPKFHAIIENITLPTAGFNPLSSNA